MTEIIQRLRAVTLLANNDVGPEPVQSAFVVKIDPAAPGVPGLGSEIKLRRSVGGVLQVAPGAAGCVIHPRRGLREIVARLLRSQQAAARGEHGAEIIGQSFVYPEQIVLHRLFVIRRGEVSRATIFSIPRMNIFVRQQAGFQFAGGFVYQSALAYTAVIGFVVLQPKCAT